MTPIFALSRDYAIHKHEEYGASPWPSCPMHCSNADSLLCLATHWWRPRVRIRPDSCNKLPPVWGYFYIVYLEQSNISPTGCYDLFCNSRKRWWWTKMQKKGDDEQKCKKKTKYISSWHFIAWLNKQYRCTSMIYRIILTVTAPPHRIQRA